MSQTPYLDRVHVASPCPMLWEDMAGDERKRICARCQEPVYFLSEMTTEEAEAFLAQYEKRPCVYYFQRQDGGVMTKDCPEGIALARRRRLASLAAAAGVTALFGLAACQQTENQHPHIITTGGK